MRVFTPAVLAIPVLAGLPGQAATEELGRGFRDHGVGTPVSTHRGTVATVDGNGRNVILSWLYDHRGGYGLLCLDAGSGEAQLYPTPYDWRGDGPFASILSSGNRYYTHFGRHFSEFDPARREFTFVRETAPNMAMSMTEDDRGRIWSATYPSSGVVCYDPATGDFRDYGHLYQQNWAQYPRSIAADDTGWIYFGIGSTRSQIIALNPDSGEATPLLAEAERVQAYATVYRDQNGQVYANTGAGDKGWMALHEGRRTDLPEPPKVNAKPYVAGSQGLFHKVFPDGSSVVEYDLTERRLAIRDPAGETHRFGFDYPSEGAHIMGLQAAPNGTVCGGTAFPMRFFAFDPRADAWERHDAYGQWNTVTALGDRYFVGGYTGGFLLEWDPSQPWAGTVKDKPESNPRFLAQCAPTINRPHDLLAYPDGRWVILAGTPGYGYTGGGLMFWDREEQTSYVLEHTDILPELSTFSLAALPNGKILGGTTVAAGTGGEQKATQAELYIMDLASRQVEWHAPVLERVNTYLDLWVSPAGLAYGFADGTRFFVFDPAERKLLHEAPTGDLGRVTGGQSCRAFVEAPDGRIFVLFVKGIVQLDPETYELKLLAESPVPIAVGGTWLDGRIYFAGGSHVYSWEVGAE